MLRFQDNVGSLLERKLQDFVHFPDSFEEQYLQEEYIYIYMYILRKYHGMNAALENCSAKGVGNNSPILEDNC